VFEDFNNNSTFETGVDTYLANGVKLVLTTLQGSTNYPDVSITNGTACFTNVAPGQYTLDVKSSDKPAGSQSTTGGAQSIILSPGQTQSFNFGFTGDVTVCPQPTFNDADFNANFENTESRINGVVTNIYRGTNLTTPYKTLTTTGSGNECFTGLFPGNYRVEQVGLNNQLSGTYWNTTGATAGDVAHTYYKDVVTAAQDFKTVEFGYTQNTDYALGAVFGNLYVDRAEDGEFDIAGADDFELTVFDNDVPVVDQTVKLFKLNTATSIYEEVESTTTDALGNYDFRRLGVGDYQVQVPNTSLIGIKSITPNPSLIPITITNNPTTGLNSKFYDQDMSFQFTAKICPFLYIDINKDGDFDTGIDYSITANEGAVYNLSYTSFNGNQSAGSYTINSGNLCIEELPPRDYRVTLSSTSLNPTDGGFGPNNEYPSSFFNQANPTLFNRTVYLASEYNDLQTRVFTNQIVNTAESQIDGTIWHNRPIYPSSDPFAGNLDTDGGDNKTEALDDVGNTSGYDYDYDNDFAYNGVTLELIKCYNGFQDPVPMAVWNANPPTTTTNSAGYYKFDSTNVQFNNGNGGFYGIVPGEYAVVRQGTVNNESSLTGVRAKQCALGFAQPLYYINSIFFDNYPSGSPNYPSNRTPRTPGITYTQNEMLLYNGSVENTPYIDQNQNLTKQSAENSCYLQICPPVPTPSGYVYGKFSVRKTPSNDIVAVVPYNIRYIGNSTIGTSSVGYGGIPGVIPGSYTIEMIDIEPIDTTTNLPHYTENQLGELIKSHTQVLNQTSNYDYGFNPLFGTEISGRVFISRNGGVYDSDGADNNSVTDFDNDEALSGYNVRIKNSSDQVVATVTTDSNGNYSWVPGGQGIPEGSYSVEVLNTPPTGTKCGSCTGSGFIGVLAGSPSFVRDLTYVYDGYIGSDAFADVNNDGFIQENPNQSTLGREIAINNSTNNSNVRTWDYTVKLTYAKGQPNETLVSNNYTTPTCGTPSVSPCVDLDSLTTSYFMRNDLKPGVYTLELTINDPTLLLTSNSQGQLTTTITLSPQGKHWTRWAFAPRTDNVISGNVFIDRGELNEIFEVAGQDGDAGNGTNAASFDNEKALTGAVVKINAPNGQIISANAVTDANGNYTITNLPTGLYRLYTNNPNGGGTMPFVETTDSIINTIKPNCISIYGCYNNNGSFNGYNFSTRQVLMRGDNITNNITYVYTNSLAAYAILDLNGDGTVTTYSNGTRDSVVGTQNYELVNTNTGKVLPCTGNNFKALANIYSGANYNNGAVCNWTELPAEINSQPAQFQIRKLANLPNQNLIVTRRKTGLHTQGNNGLSLGAINDVNYTFNLFGLNQQQSIAYYQSSAVVTNNASITGFAFIDLNGDGIYQPNGVDNNPLTTQDNETPLTGTSFVLSGDANRTISAGTQGQYQFTDLAAGNYSIASDLNAGVGSYTMRITNAQRIIDSINGDFYRVSFTTQGFKPSVGGRYIRFYWDTQTTAATGREHYVATNYETLVSTKPANATQICSVVMNTNNTPIPNSGDCQPFP
jgi:hypothetical protein